jgi:hypothetical protein
MASIQGEHGLAVMKKRLLKLGRGMVFLLFLLVYLTASPAPQTASRSVNRPVSLDIEPAVLSLSAGKEVPLKVTGTYRDGTTAVLTNKTTYASQDPSVAS